VADSAEREERGRAGVRRPNPSGSRFGPLSRDRVRMPSGDIVPADWAADIRWAEQTLARLVASETEKRPLGRGNTS
jgi:hypothetical protein